MRQARRQVLCVCALLLALTTIIVASGAEAGERVVPEPEFNEPFAVLALGTTSQLHWGVLLYRHQGRPCLDLTVDTEGIVQCEKPAPLVVVTDSAGSGKRKVTVVGVLGARRVDRVRLEIAGGKRRSLRVKPVGSMKAARARVARSFRFAVVVLRGPACVRGYSAYRDDGTRVFVSQAHECD